MGADDSKTTSRSFSRNVPRPGRVLTELCLAVAMVTSSCGGGSSASPTSSVPATSTPAPLSVSAWLPYWDDGTGLTSFTDNLTRFDKIHPFFYEATSADKITLQTSRSKHDKVVTTAKNDNVLVVPTVTSTIKSVPFLELLRDPARRSLHATTLCDLAIENHYDGIDMNYEQFAVTPEVAVVSELAKLYVDLVTEVSTCLHNADKQLEVTVMARTDNTAFAAYRPKLAIGVYDYEALGKLVDVLRPMAYDFHYPGGESGSLDPLDWVEKVAEYAASKVDPLRIELGIPLYGQDWVGNGADVVPTRQGPSLAAENAATPTRDATGSMTFEYRRDGKTHTVWYDDSTATLARVEIARRHRLHGVSFWALGYEDQTFWQDLAERVRVTS